MTQASLSRVSEITTSALNRYFSGDYRPDVDILERLCRAFEPIDRCRLVVAHLRDETPENVKQWIDPQIVNLDGAKESPPAYRPVEMSPGLAADFDVLMRAAMRSDEAKKWIHSTAEFIRSSGDDC